MLNWLSDLRVFVSENESELLPMFDVYAGEASFGRTFIDNDLTNLSQGSKIVEIGAGSLLLSCQLVREGFDIVAVEPIGEGFGHFSRMQELIILHAKKHSYMPSMLNLPAEVLNKISCFDYAFSINVMEHVNDVNLCLNAIGKSLKPGGSYRFTCPNYTFPYEPHFNIPTLFNKKITEKIFYGRIFDNTTVPDPVGTWKSLNWISVWSIKRFLRQQSVLKGTFNASLLVSTFERVLSDGEFVKRRSKWVSRVIIVIVKLRLHHFLRFIPVSLQPIIDCKITKIYKIYEG
jgi:SAM-dependent methyltransferase